jgi:hypothetical protein
MDFLAGLLLSFTKGTFQPGLGQDQIKPAEKIAKGGNLKDKACAMSECM